MKKTNKIINFKEASTLAEKNGYLIGKNYKGGRIDERIIYPTEKNPFNEFSKKYIKSGNAQEALNSYTNIDLSVVVVTNKSWIKNKLVFLYTDISNLPDDLGVIDLI